MGQTEINLFVNSDIYNCTDCANDSRLGYYVFWGTNNDLNGFDSYSGVTSVTVWDNVYFAVSNSESCYIGQSSSISIDGSIYTLCKISLRLDLGSVVDSPTLGKIQFQTSEDSTWDDDKSVTFEVTVDNAYHEYKINLASKKTWSGSITKLRVYPFIDGGQGIKIHLRYIKLESLSEYNCSSGLTGSICDKAYLYSHPCPWIGSPGSSISERIDGAITITAGSNDKILVNIDDYGEQGITLKPVVGATIQDVARDIQDKLNLIGIGGYAYARCYAKNSRIHIESDWFSSESTVVVTEPSDNSACRTLSFFDSSGLKIATEESGVDSASRYERSPLQLNSSAIRKLRDSGSKIKDRGAFLIDGSSYSPQGGNKNYRFFSQDKKLTFKNKTLIDYDNPITYNGIITFVGYSGDAYSNTEFRVYRQRINGWLELVGSVDMSVSTDSEDGIFEKSTSLSVKKGDLLSLYSAALHLGSTYDKENYSYILVDYKLAYGGKMWELNGAGNKGLPLFARGSRKTDEAELVVEFDEAQFLESVYVSAEEKNVFEEINICTVRNGGLNGGPHISGSTGVGEGGAPALSVKNLDALIDGDKQNVNGTSLYCYPEWLDLDAEDRSDYDYTNFEIVFDFAKGINVYFPIYKIVHYFVDKNNIKTFRWEVPIATNSEDTSRIWGTGWSSYKSVYTELGLMDSESIYLYSNPSVVVASDYQVSSAHLKYNYLELVLNDPFLARSLKYNVTLDGFNVTDSAQDNYAYFPPAPSPKIQEIEIYIKSTPEKNISDYFYFESSKLGTEYLVHDDTHILSSTKARYTIGRPTKALKIHITSNNELEVFDIRGIISENSITIDSGHSSEVALTPAKISSPSEVETVVVTNDGDTASNFYINIFNSGSHSERCLLWNKLSHDDSIGQSEIGSGGIIRRRTYKALRPFNYAYKCPGYFLDKLFFFGSPTYVSRDDKTTWFSVGSVITDGSDDTYVTNENAFYYKYPYVYVAVDLGANYAIDSVDIFSGSFDSFSNVILYSSMDTSDPSDVPNDSSPNGWHLSSKENARWVLFRSASVGIGHSGITYITHIEINTDYTARLNRGKNIWTSADGNLTNGIPGGTGTGQEEGWIVNGQADYFCVDLGWWHNVSNIITGPMGDAADSIEDVDAVEAGSWPSIVDASCTSENVAYSKSSTTDPSKVVWGDFGEPPNNPVKWVLVKAENSRVEEIIVHTDNSIPNDKYSFFKKEWASSVSADVYEEYAHTRSGICALSLDYPVDADQREEYILINQSFGVDSELAKRDALSFWFYISDVSQIDFNYGFFRLGKAATEENNPKDINLTMDEYNYYEWPLSLFEDYIVSGWTHLRMPFSDNYKNGNIFFASDDISRIGETYKRDRIKYFKFAFRGINSNNAFTVRLDDFNINRRYYSDGKYDFGAYIPNNEYIKFPMNDFDPMKGTVEFFLKSDWTKEITCNSCQDPRDHTIFRIYNTEDSSLFMLFMTGTGLKFYVSDGENPTIITDNTFSTISVDTPTHIAVVWDFTGLYDSPTMGIYVDGIFTVGIEYDNIEQYGAVRPSFVQRSLYTMMVGGRAWSGLVSYDSSSVDGVIENLMVFNYPKTDFSSALKGDTFFTPLRPSDLILISLDNITFYGIEDTEHLPLFKQNVESLESFNVYIKSRDLDKTKDGENNRLAHISIVRTPT